MSVKFNNATNITFNIGVSSIQFNNNKSSSSIKKSSGGLNTSVNATRKFIGFSNGGSVINGDKYGVNNNTNQFDLLIKELKHEVEIIINNSLALEKFESGIKNLLDGLGFKLKNISSYVSMDDLRLQLNDILEAYKCHSVEELRLKLSNTGYTPKTYTMEDLRLQLINTPDKPKTHTMEDLRLQLINTPVPVKSYRIKDLISRLDYTPDRPKTHTMEDLRLELRSYLYECDYANHHGLKVPRFKGLDHQVNYKSCISTSPKVRDFFYIKSGKRLYSTSNSNSFMNSLDKLSYNSDVHEIKSDINSNGIVEHVTDNNHKYIGPNEGMFTRLANYFGENDFKVSHKSQLKVEEYLIQLIDPQKGIRFVNGIDLKLLSGDIVELFDSKSYDLELYINRLIESGPSKNHSEEMVIVLKKVGKEYLKQLSIYVILQICTYYSSDNDESVKVLNTSVKIGESIISEYFRLVKKDFDKTILDAGTKHVRYSEWITSYKHENKIFYDTIISGEFKAILAGRLIDILRSCEFIDTTLSTKSITVKSRDFVIANKALLKLAISKKNVFTISPTKLPMMVKPKCYDRNSLGGYLLNDKDYKDDMFSYSVSYKTPSTIEEGNNKLYKLINNISGIPFKVNKEVLDFIHSDKGNFLLMDKTELSKYDGEIKLSAYKKKIMQSLTSKYINQELVLRIANLYKNFKSIYFPVMLDSRGRLYCRPQYFNYQSTDLAKGLLLFSKPGIINKNDLSSVKYIKAFGVNCYGLDKNSLDYKLTWVDNNLDNIINYENGILLKQAKEKVLFLAFCIEYKKYINFLNNESLSEFETYLPVQLDATCNGFQHLSLLSNETALFKDLNLTNTGDTPGDFYTLVLSELHKELKKKLEDPDVEQTKIDSYKRLNKLKWERTHVKQLLMTLPYNAGRTSQKKYIKEALIQGDFDNDIKSYWWHSSNNELHCINKSDIELLISILGNIITTKYSNVKKLMVYLKKVASLFNLLDLPIHWSLPSGLNIYQTYLYKMSIGIEIFTHSRIKLNLQKIDRNSYDDKKQIRALMPNLVHSLDAYSMTELYHNLNDKYVNTQFFSVHDCFGTTCEKVDDMKDFLANVYTMLYLNEPYLIKFDKGIIKYIKDNTNNVELKEEGATRLFYIQGTEKPFKLPDVYWVFDSNSISKLEYPKISSKFILV